MAENSQEVMESTSKLRLPLDVKVHESGDNNGQLLEGDELPVGEVKCKLGNNEHKMWQDGPADGEEDNTVAQTCLVDGPSAMEMSEIFLPELPVERILEYLSFADLKSMHSVCFDANTNSVISSSLKKRGCLALHPNTKNPPIGSELEGWSSLRLRDFLQSVDYSVDDEGDGRWPAVWDDCLGVDYFKKNAKHLLQVTCLDLQNSFVHHMTVLDLLPYFQNLETFQFVFNLTGDKKYKEHVNSVIENTMSKIEEDIIEEEVQGQLWKDKYQNSSYPPISSIRNVRISIPSMIIANAMIRVLEYRCDQLESFKLEADIYRLVSTMRNEADYYKAISVLPDLFLKNKPTLKKFEFMLTPNFVDFKFQFEIHQASQSSAYRFLAGVTVQQIIQIRGLHLVEFTLSIPLSFREDIHFEEGVSVLDMLKNFLIDQAGSLKLIQILQLEWFVGTESSFDKNALGGANVELEIVLNYTCEPGPKWNKIQDFIKGLTILPDAAQFKNISSLFPNSDPLPKVRSYSLETYTKYAFEGWQMPYVLEKFPNLTELTIRSHARFSTTICIHCRQRRYETYQPWTYFGDLQVHDQMLQLILEKLPKLQVLDLDLYMANLTDFGITGISQDAQERMKSENAYITKPGDKIGFSLPNGLKILSLVGIAGLVSNASVYLTLRKLTKLKKLVMSSPKFTKNGMRVLKDAFEGQQDFELRIYKTGELERKKYTFCKCGW